MSGLFFAVGLLWILSGVGAMPSDFSAQWWATLIGIIFLGASVNYALTKIKGK